MVTNAGTRLICYVHEDKGNVGLTVLYDKTKKKAFSRVMLISVATLKRAMLETCEHLGLVVSLFFISLTSRSPRVSYLWEAPKSHVTKVLK